jgi:cytochrome c oxidase assembly protein subunit 15
MKRVSTRVVAIVALAATALLNLQGAVVRATGSGAGCGEHWPTCNGEVVPLAPSTETLLEFSHRLLSLLVLLFGLWLLKRAYESRRERKGLWYATLGALFFFVLQSLVGAFTVVMGLTGDNTSMLRGVILPIHLINSFSMVGALVLAVLYAGANTPGRLALRRYAPVAVLTGLGLLGMYLLTFTGGIAALGNTIFPSESLRAGLAADFDPESHPLIRLRALHPLVGATVGVYLFLSLGLIYWLRNTIQVKRASQQLFTVYVAQLAIGVVNLVTLAPIVLQLVHLSVAMLVFALFVKVSAYALGVGAEVPVAQTSRAQTRPLAEGAPLS